VTSDTSKSPTPSQSGAETDGATLEAVEQKLAPVLEGIPEPKRTEIRHQIEQTFMAAVVRAGTAAPQLDPETAKILADTVQRDNDNKFKFLSQKQADTAKRESMAHQLATARHRDLMKPIVWAVIGITFVSVVAGLWFIAAGHESVGSSLLTGIFGALLGYLGGLGTSGHLKGHS